MDSVYSVIMSQITEVNSQVFTKIYDLTKE